MPLADESNTDACARIDVITTKPIGHSEERLDSLGDGLAVADVRNVREQYGELISSEPGDRIARAEQALDPSSRFNQELVADAMTERVVNEFEPIDVEEKKWMMLLPRHGT